MAQQTSERLTRFLRENGKSFDRLTKNQQKKFIDIDRAIQRRIDMIEKTQEELMQYQISVKAIAEDTGIKRPLFYQMPLYDAFIKSCYSYNPNFQTENETKIKNRQIAELQEQIGLMLKRDIEYAEKICELNARINEIDKEKQTLEGKLDILQHGYK